MGVLGEGEEGEKDHSQGRRFQLNALSGKIVDVRGVGFQRYVAMVALVGRPEMSAYEQRCQIDQLIAGVNKITKQLHYDGGDEPRNGEDEKEVRDVNMNFLVSFRAATPPKYPSDAALREKLREKPDLKTSLERKKVEVDGMEVEFGHRVGWWKVSTYVVVAGCSSALVERRAEGVANILTSVWSGSHFSPRCILLSSKEIVGYFPRIIRRDLLPRKYVTEMSSMRLSSLVHLPEEPHPPLTRVTAPLFEAPDPKTFTTGGGSRGIVEFGDVLGPSGIALYPLTLPVDDLSKHLAVFGESGFGKTCFVIILLDQVQQSGCVPFLVLDQKGEYRCLLSCARASIVYFLPASSDAPLWINLFDPQGDDPDTHTKYIFNIIREILFANRTELTPQMERVLNEVLRMNVAGDWNTFNTKLSEFLEEHGEELPQLGVTLQGILNRIGQFTRPPLSHVFNCKKSNVNFSYLVQRNVIIDLSEVRRMGTPEDVRLLANVIAKYVSTSSLRRGADCSGKLKHLFVVDDALDVVPEILAKKTTAEVGIIEHMAMLLRATGQGLIVVSQHPNVSENVIANSAIKVFFRSVVDSRDAAAWMNLSEEQQAYLKSLPKQEAIVTVEQYTGPIRMKTRDISDVLRSKVTLRDIVQNNTIYYPLMYDMQKEEMDACEVEKEGVTRNSETHSQTRIEMSKEEAGQGRKKDQAEEQKQGGTRKAGGSSILSPEAREAWSRLREYLGRGIAVDSDFVSKMLGGSQSVAHRTMLSLKIAGLVGVAKVSNYAYGEGYQYLYYSQEKSIYGGGVIGYLRERMHDDLTGMEAVVELSPRDVPSADMILENKYPVVIHPISSGSNHLILKALKQRIANATKELSLKVREGLRQGGGCVIVVSLWRNVAGELEGARRRGELGDSCLCVIPFSRQSVSLLADYVLRHTSLNALRGEEQKKEVDEEAATHEGVEVEIEKGDLRAKVLKVVRELGGVEPRVIAERVGVPVYKVSRVAKKLKEEGVIKIATNLPYITSLKKPNSLYYLDAQKPTALHDTLMNELWKRNIDLGGKCRDYAFELGKTWHTDGLLENAGGQFLLEVVAGEYSDRIPEQINAYVNQLHVNSALKGVVVVVIDNNCLEKLRREILGNNVSSGASLFMTSLRSRNEKQQFESLLRKGDLAVYHRNPT